MTEKLLIAIADNNRLVGLNHLKPEVLRSEGECYQ